MARPPSNSEFHYKVGSKLLPLHSVLELDFCDIEQLRVTLTLLNGKTLIAEGLDALELAMQTKPSILEGRRLRWPKFAWMVHNLVGHPLMQIFALMGAYSLAFAIHERTVPRPRGGKEAKPS